MRIAPQSPNAILVQIEIHKIEFGRRHQIKPINAVRAALVNRAERDEFRAGRRAQKCANQRWRRPPQRVRLSCKDKTQTFIKKTQQTHRKKNTQCVFPLTPKQSLLVRILNAVNRGDALTGARRPHPNVIVAIKTINKDRVVQLVENQRRCVLAVRLGAAFASK